jgi:hypothetical protein
MDRDHVLFDEFEKVIQLISSSGLMLYYVRYFNWYFFIRWLTYENELTEPEVFSIDKLSYGFVIWLGACGVSTFTFLLELTYGVLVFILKNIVSNVIRRIIKCLCENLQNIGKNVSFLICRLKRRGILGFKRSENSLSI